MLEKAYAVLGICHLQVPTVSFLQPFPLFWRPQKVAPNLSPLMLGPPRLLEIELGDFYLPAMCSHHLSDCPSPILFDILGVFGTWKSVTELSDSSRKGWLEEM